MIKLIAITEAGTIFFTGHTYKTLEKCQAFLTENAGVVDTFTTLSFFCVDVDALGKSFNIGLLFGF